MGTTMVRTQAGSSGGRLSAFIRRYPLLSLLVLAMLFASVPTAAVAGGLLPPGAAQLSALSASAAGIVLAVLEGRRGGLRELLGRSLVWRAGIGWWLFVLLFPILPSVASLYLFQAAGGPAVDWSGLKPIASVVPMIIILTIAAGVGEEFGWRGYALPRLQRRHSALAAAVLSGLAWGTWHIPLFFTPGTTQYAWRMEAGLLVPVLGYAVFCAVWAIQYTWVFNNTKGSVLLAAVMHGAGNAWISAYINVYRGHFGGVLAFLAVSAVVSMVIVLATGPANLSRSEERNMLEADAE